MGWFNKSAKTLLNEGNSLDIFEKLKPIFEYVGDSDENGGISSQLRSLLSLPKLSEAKQDVRSKVETRIARIRTKSSQIREELTYLNRYLKNLNTISNVDQKTNLKKRINDEFDKIKVLAKGLKVDAEILKQNLKSGNLATSPADNIENFARSIVNIVA